VIIKLRFFALRPINL